MVTLDIPAPKRAASSQLGDPEPQARAGSRLPANLIEDVVQAVPPLWPLKDFAAVNPFTGLTDRTLIDVHQMMGRLRGADLLMSRAYFQEQWHLGRISRHSIEVSLTQCNDEYPSILQSLTVDQIVAWLSNPSLDTGDTSRPRLTTMAEMIDRASETSWKSTIVNEVSRHCAAHFDQGQAIWASPWRHLPLYEAWRSRAAFDGRMAKIGLTTLSAVIAELPAEPIDAVADLLEELGVPKRLRTEYALMQVFSVGGWASFLRYRIHIETPQAERDLIALLAMRLAHDVALARLHPDLHSKEAIWRNEPEPIAPSQAKSEPVFDVLARYILQVATECEYRENLARALVERDTPVNATVRKGVQMVFCIDVRSELMRRHLEAIDGGIQTMGFAGFFGIAMSYLPLGESEAVAQCPVLLKPTLTVNESFAADEAARTQAARSRRVKRLGRKTWKRFQTSAASCFSFVESLGLGYLGGLMADSLRLADRADRSRFDGVSPHHHTTLGPTIDAGLTLELRVALAEGMLRNLGLTENFARLVVLCGHGSSVTNNPFKASLDCGACGGHSGEPNARFAAMLLNQPEVRATLRQRGIAVPADTWFMAAVHDTTTDQIRFFDTSAIPKSHRQEFDALEHSTTKATALVRAERARRLRATSDRDVLRRSLDWCELRPEWGLAGNAAFVVARRERTQGLNLGGRVFLHEYQHEKDPDSKVLELIMTAPMVVTNWINMQYYASSVAPRTYGAGNKAIHNVTGCLGVAIGNGGDLATGLPLQSVHDGDRLQHEPIRLQVFIEAPRHALDSIIDRHELVKNLVENGWVYLISLDGDEAYLRAAKGIWRSVSTTPQRRALPSDSLESPRPTG